MSPTSAQRAHFDNLLHNLHLKIDYRRIWLNMPYYPRSKNILIDAIIYITLLKQYQLIRIDRAKVSYADLMHRLGELIGHKSAREEMRGVGQANDREEKEVEEQKEDRFTADCVVLKTAASYIDHLLKREAGFRDNVWVPPKSRVKQKRRLSPTLDAMEPHVKRYRPSVEPRLISSGAEQKGGTQEVAKIAYKNHTAARKSPDLDPTVKKDSLDQTLDKIDTWAGNWLAGNLEEAEWDRFEKCVD